MASLKDILGSCSRNNRDTYQKWFDCIDSDRDGRILVDEAKDFFSRTRFEDQYQLKKVWAYADSKGQGFLYFEEFIVAMQLLSLAKDGHELNADLLKSTFHEEVPVMESLDPLFSDYRDSRTDEGNVGPMSSLKRCLSSKLRKKKRKNEEDKKFERTSKHLNEQFSKQMAKAEKRRNDEEKLYENAMTRITLKADEKRKIADATKTGKLYDLQPKLSRPVRIDQLTSLSRWWK